MDGWAERPTQRHGTQLQLEDGLRRRGDAERTVYAEVPPRVEYALTDFGRSLAPVLAAMQSWGAAFKERMLARQGADASPERTQATDGD